MRAPEVVTPFAVRDPGTRRYALVSATGAAGRPRCGGRPPAGAGTAAGVGTAACAGRARPRHQSQSQLPPLRVRALAVTGPDGRGGRADTGGRGERAETSGRGERADTGGHREWADASGHGERAELRSLFEDAAAGLNLGEREIIELRLRQGLAAREMASVLGVSRGRALRLLARARNQLELCLGVLLVGRTGRGECGELRCLLAGWDGRLTAAVRKRVYVHIEHCPTCAARRALELRPARLLDRSPGAALAAGAAESFRFTLGAPSALRAHTIALAAGRSPGAAAHSSDVLARAGSFGKRGFPRPAGAGRAGLAGQCGFAARAARRRFGRQQRPVVAAVALIAFTLAAACALLGHTVHFASAGPPKPSASVPASPAPASKTVRPGTATPLVPGNPVSGIPVSATPVSGTPMSAISVPGTPVSGISVPAISAPASDEGRTTHNSPFTKPPRQLRSWIESNRLR